ncbi:hypothetical protein [Acinetobacter sp. CFCC 10889]|uniref:hypothetical protein n=1 Tax=Acinetobacter sp. CFCC 10889 TaxID=1775557 RepID=UPI000DD049F2|nr:hypothetical protein [Acinetobacter sp. CFCC 10889]
MIKNLLLLVILQIFYIGLVLFLHKLGLNEFINIAIMSFILGVCSHYLLDSWIFKLMLTICLSALFIALHGHLMFAVFLSCYGLALTIFQFNIHHPIKTKYELHPH